MDLISRMGQHFADSAQTKRDAAELLAAPIAHAAEMMVASLVGNGKILENGERRPLEVKKGDKVLFGKYSGQTVKVDGEELLVMREEDIMGIVE